MEKLVDLLREVVNRLLNRKKDELGFVATQLKEETDPDSQNYKYLKAKKERLQLEVNFRITGSTDLNSSVRFDSL
jgi:hypothetical protein